MNKKLIPTAFLASLAVAGCDGNDEPTGPRVDTFINDTSSGSDTATSSDTSTGGSDTTTPPDTNQAAGTVKALQVEAESVTCNATGIVDVNPFSTLTNAVVISPKFDASPSAQPNTFTGYYVADQDGGSYSGITIRVPVALAADLVPGDVVDLTGQLKEAFCLTQLDVATLTEKTPVSPLAPVAVANAADLNNEAYESMLVKLSNVTVTKASAEGGWKVGDLEVGFQFDEFISFVDGGTYDITGVVRFAFGKYQLVPRYATDVVKLGGGTTTAITDIQGASISTVCPEPAPQFQNGVAGVELAGVVVTPRFNVTQSLHGYVVSDGTTAPFSAVIVTVPGNLNTNFVAGDEVKVTGDHQEYYCQTQFRASAIEKTGGPANVPAPASLAKNASAEDLEKHEGLLVELTDVSVTGDDGYGAAQTDAGVLIDKTLMGEAFTAPASGTKLSKVRGIVTFRFNAYRVSPRGADDIVVAP
jgi:predicted extracellular nuclease